MKTIILAAGEGRRLRPFTENKPKCMVLFQEKPIIDYIINTTDDNDLRDISIISGYKEDVLRKYIKEKHEDKKISLHHNSHYKNTNMVYTLFCAEDLLDGTSDVIISYADIIYNKEILNQLMKAEDNIAIVVDKDWEKLWQLRMDNPLDDAETMKFDDQGSVSELGKKPKSYEEIEGQYIGLIKISKNVIKEVKKFYYSLDRKKIYDGKDFNNMYMTTFLQLLIDTGFKVRPVMINGGWLEIDSVEDLDKLQDYKW
ncbi:Choline kinase [Natronincola peptidivorans]|uniref:Choline kinase n=1 Tax=Natronincola peptidivorans TaxID=426128 RepID=A0A1H9ZTE1_9FIRM|nr:phosphocholine cytidylyltransferase family protein [Natronincola peptidivorans]SES84993.1 Choline kinase [Natronincola peptidivorans]